MANNGEPLQYMAKAYLAMGNSDFMLVTDFTVATANQGKVVKTQRGGVVGVARGHVDVNISFNAVQGEDGAEHDYEKLVEKGTLVTLRVKKAGGRITVYSGIFTTHNFGAPLEDTPTDALTFVGRGPKR